MSAVQIEESGSQTVRMSRVLPGLLRPQSGAGGPNNQATMVVVGADGRTKTVLKAPAAAEPSKPAATKANDPPNPFKYKVPISKYNTLHSVAVKRQQQQQHRKQQLKNSLQQHQQQHLAPLPQPPRPSQLEPQPQKPLPKPQIPEQQRQQQPIIDSHERLEKEYNALKSKEQEEQVELRRLRTENRLLRQRIENLEKETATLADRLIQDQVKHAQQEEEMFAVRRQLFVAKQQSDEATQELIKATDQLQFNRCKSAPAATGLSNEEQPEEAVIQSVNAVDKAKDEQIELLQQELVDVRKKEVDSSATVCQLKHKVQELENVNSQLQTEPSAQVQSLQEELAACKLREAESNLSLKEMQQKVVDLERHYQKFVEKSNAIPPSGKAGKHKIEQLQEDLMALRLREGKALADNKETKQQLMELQTANHIYERQVKRLETENDKLKSQVEDQQAQEKTLSKSIKDLERKQETQQEKRKEDVMMLKIKDAEHSQMVAEMRHRIAELEIENQELITAGQLQGKGDKEDLENTIADLKEEVLQLKMARRLHSISSLAINNISLDSESDYDTDIETTLNNSKLNLSDSLIGDSAGNLVPPRRPQINLDLNDNDSDEDEEGQKKVNRKKRRNRCSKEVDLDKTPTADSVNADFALPPSNSNSPSSLSSATTD